MNRLPEGAGAERAVELPAVGGGLGVDPPDVRPQVAQLREPDGAEVALVGFLPGVLPGVQHQRVLLAEGPGELFSGVVRFHGDN